MNYPSTHDPEEWQFAWKDKPETKYWVEGFVWKNCDFRSPEPERSEDKPTPDQNSLLFNKLRFFFDASGHCDVTTSWKELQQKWEPYILRLSGAQESQPEEISELEEIFNGLVENWTRQTEGHSVTARRYAHPSYQAILALGKEAIPLILRRLEEKPDWWFEALTALAQPEHNPVAKGASFSDAVEAWLEWGRQNRFIR
jgi:hypothetical protein